CQSSSCSAATTGRSRPFSPTRTSRRSPRPASASSGSSSPLTIPPFAEPPQFAEVIVADVLSVATRAVALPRRPARFALTALPASFAFEFEIGGSHGARRGKSVYPNVVPSGGSPRALGDAESTPADLKSAGTSDVHPPPLPAPPSVPNRASPPANLKASWQLSSSRAVLTMLMFRCQREDMKRSRMGRSARRTRETAGPARGGEREGAGGAGRECH